MKLLMIGGTMFLGRHIVQRAIESGHEVTIFTRGKHNPDLFPEAKNSTAIATAISRLRRRRLP